MWQFWPVFRHLNRCKLIFTLKSVHARGNACQGVVSYLPFRAKPFLALFLLYLLPFKRYRQKTNFDFFLSWIFLEFNRYLNLSTVCGLNINFWKKIFIKMLTYLVLIWKNASISSACPKKCRQSNLGRKGKFWDATFLTTRKKREVYFNNVKMHKNSIYSKIINSKIMH